MTMRDEMRRSSSALGVTAIHVTHDREEAMAIADRLVIMDAGGSRRRHARGGLRSPGDALRRRLHGGGEPSCERPRRARPAARRAPAPHQAAARPPRARRRPAVRRLFPRRCRGLDAPAAAPRRDSCSPGRIEHAPIPAASTVHVGGRGRASRSTTPLATAGRRRRLRVPPRPRSTCSRRRAPPDLTGDSCACS